MMRVRPDDSVERCAGDSAMDALMRAIHHSKVLAVLAYGGVDVQSRTSCLAALDLQRQAWIHERRAAVNGERLPGDPSGFFGTQQGDSIADVGGSPQATHRRPTFFVPVF